MRERRTSTCCCTSQLFLAQSNGYNSRNNCKPEIYYRIWHNSLNRMLNMNSLTRKILKSSPLKLNRLFSVLDGALPKNQDYLANKNYMDALVADLVNGNIIVCCYTLFYYTTYYQCRIECTCNILYCYQTNTMIVKCYK